VLQPIANALYSASQIALVAVGLTLIYAVGRYMHFAHGATFTVSAYGALVCSRMGLPPLIAAGAGTLMGGLFGVLTHLTIYRPLQRLGSSSMTILLASLGLLTVVQGAIAMAFGEGVQILRTANVSEGNIVMGARLTEVQLTGLIGGCCLCLMLSLWLVHSAFGRNVRAVANDIFLAELFGINTNVVNIYIAMIAGLLAGYAGVVSAWDIDARPTMGFQPLLLGMVAMLTGGAGRTFGAMAAALLVGAAQQFAVSLLGSEWQDTVIFVLLAVVLFFRPQGIFMRLQSVPGA
jgi:branched-chain amino acid transport system permease protein